MLSEDEEKLVKSQQTKILEYFGRKSKSPEPSSAKPRKLSVDEVSPPVPKRRKKKKNAAAADCSSRDSDGRKSPSGHQVDGDEWSAADTRQQPQPIEQKDHWGLYPGLKSNNCGTSVEHLPNAQTASSDCKTKGEKARATKRISPYLRTRSGVCAFVDATPISSTTDKRENLRPGLVFDIFERSLIYHRFPGWFEYICIYTIEEQRTLTRPRLSIRRILYQ